MIIYIRSPEIRRYTKTQKKKEKEKEKRNFWREKIRTVPLQTGQTKL